MFLSPHYDIVRYKGTSVFLNCLTIEPRSEVIGHVRLPRVFKQYSGPFKKANSVFNAIKDDTKEALAEML